MAHLKDDELLDLARSASDAHGEHLQECSECAERLEMWRTLAESLPAVVREEVSASEMHRLRTLFRHYRPESRSVVRWVASLVRTSAAPATAAIRGVSTSDLFEYAAGPFTLLLESGPASGGRFQVHGQVFNEAGVDLSGSTVVFSAGDEKAQVEAIDEFGEFHLEVADAGEYQATVMTGGGTFRVDDIRVGEPLSD